MRNVAKGALALLWPETVQGFGLDETALPADLLKAADQARDSRAHARAAYLYTAFLKHRPDAAGIWIQLGHMLKEVGFYTRSFACYERAWSFDQGDADLALQIGHLEKTRGHFESAVAWYRKASTLGHPLAAWLNEEIRAISIPVAATSAKVQRQVPVPGTVRIYLSSDAGDVSKMGAKALKGVVGQAHYSYSFALRGFAEALTELDIEFVLLANPEFLTHIRDHSDAAVNIHVGFYPPDRIRLMKGAYNILAMAWEFERFRSAGELPTHHAFEPVAEMLALVDEIWSPSEYGSAALRRTTDRPVTTVPSPVLVGARMKPRIGKGTFKDVAKHVGALGRPNWVPLATVPIIQPTMRDEAHRRRSSLASILFNNFDAEPPVIFYTVFNVYDHRKNIRPMLDGFVRLAKKRANVFLLMKVSLVGEDEFVLNDRVLQEQLARSHELFPPLVSDRVWMTCDALTRDEMERLYDLAAFYVSSAHAEGQNLPLLEAMARGVVPVTVRHTAMDDYITDENALIMQTVLRPIDLHLAHRYRMPDIETNYLEPEEAYRQLDRASGMSDAEYATLSAAALGTVRRQFGADRLETPLATAVERATARLAHLA